jgi:hypothetical protein
LFDDSKQKPGEDEGVLKEDCVLGAEFGERKELDEDDLADMGLGYPVELGENAERILVVDQQLILAPGSRAVETFYALVDVHRVGN